jgi:drug/metabolite transporter (DMT)-like permease
VAASDQVRRGAAAGLAAALLFGASAPIAKRLLPSSEPLVLSALFYLGAGLLLSIGRIGRPRRQEAPLVRGDVPWLLALTVLGGAVAPVLLLFGLERVRGVSGSLLLNLEAPFTLLVAVAVFEEHATSRVWAAAACVFAGAVVIEGGAGPSEVDLVGVVAITGACLAWAVDNNITQRLSLRDPVRLVQIKALGAGGGLGLLVVVTGRPWPDHATVLAALGVGGLCYGVSILLDVLALRALGAGREAALFATAPFAGAALAVPLLDEPVGAASVGAALLMALGVALFVSDDHAHEHDHLQVGHEHAHTHDEHHAHDLADDVAVTAPHSHWHPHRPLRHRHGHVSDAHHRHAH